MDTWTVMDPRSLFNDLHRKDLSTLGVHTFPQLVFRTPLVDDEFGQLEGGD